MKKEIMQRIRNTPIENTLVFVAICISVIGLVITVIGAFLNGFMTFNGQKDLSTGFGIILMGNSIALLGVVTVVMAFIVYIFKDHFSQTEIRT